VGAAPGQATLVSKNVRVPSSETWGSDDFFRVMVVDLKGGLLLFGFG